MEVIIHMNLFRKKVERACQHCIHAIVSNEKNVICTKKKKYSPVDAKCVHFKYDPLKRVPSKAKAMDFSKYEEYDFSL